MARATILYLDHTAQLGGGEIALADLLRHLNRERFRPVVALGEDGPLVERLRALDVETQVVPLAADLAQTRRESLQKNRAGLFSAAARSLAYARHLARLLREQDAQLIHTNSLKAHVLGGFAGRRAGVPVVWHVRDRIETDALPARAVGLIRLLSRFLPDVVIANSQATLTTLRLPSNRRTAIAYSGVTLSDYPPLPLPHLHTMQKGKGESDLPPTPLPQGTGRNHLLQCSSLPREEQAASGERPEARVTPPTSCLIGLIGRITPWKGQHIFLRAARQVHEQFPEARFQIVGAALFGETAYEQEMRRLAESLGLHSCLEFTGFRSDVPQLLREMDILVHASTSGEPFGQVVAQGMAAGRPVVATNGGAIPELVVPGETGLLIPMDNAEAMAEAILSLLRCPEQARAMGRAGRRRVEQLFTIEQTVKVVEGVYESLLQERRFTV